MTKFFAGIMIGIAGIWHGMFGAHAPANNLPYNGMPGQNRSANPNGSSMIGTVSNISGATLTIQVVQRPNPTATTTSSVDFTVDTSGARIIKSGSTTTATVANIKIGDRVIAQGVINGNSIVAKLVIDTLSQETQVQKPQPKPSTATSTKTKVTPKAPVKKK